MDKFKVAEIVEKSLTTYMLVENGIEFDTIRFTEGFAQHDGEFVDKKGQTVKFETKVRNVPSDRYSTTIIEESKYEYLMAEELPTYLFVFFTDCKVFVQNVKKAEVSKKKKKAPKTTAGDNKKIEKTFVEFDIKKGITLNY